MHFSRVYTVFGGLLPLCVATQDSIFYNAKIKVTNEAPEGGTCLSPPWIGFHDGTFDTYDGGAPLTTAMERLAEDGNNEPIAAVFATNQPRGLDATVGMTAICPGQSQEITVFLEAQLGIAYYFSYASMILPSNDAFVANGNPMAHLAFNADGRFNGLSIQVLGDEVNDGGTEVNDELPQNTAFFGQMTPDTGVDENGVVFGHIGFNPVGSGGILDAEEFRMADFTAENYKIMTIDVTAEEVPGYGFIVHLIDQSGFWCLSAPERRANGTLRLRRCDFDAKPSYQLWMPDSQNRLRSAIDQNRCMRVGQGELFDGVRLRLGTCNDEYSMFELDLNTQYLKVDGDFGREYCVTNQGAVANHDDTILAFSCPSNVLDDYQWEFYSIDSV